MKRRSEFLPNSKIIQTKNDRSQNQPKKSRNIPSEIWLKRNILKKLTLQLKFNKNYTHQYRKFREILTDTEPLSQNERNLFSNKQPKQNESQILTPSKQAGISKWSTGKVEKISKYSDNFFASNAFSKNGLKSYHYKSSMCQGNNFINVSKAIILQKKNVQKKSDSNFYHKRSLSQRQIKHEEPEKDQIKPKRSFSAHRSTKSQHLDKNTDFLKVTTKQLHFSNIDAFQIDCTRQNRNIFSRKFKTETKTAEIMQNTRPKMIETKPKISLNLRPKSCMVKSNRFFEFSNCEGWVTATGKNQRQQDEPFQNIFQL